MHEHMRAQAENQQTRVFWHRWTGRFTAWVKATTQKPKSRVLKTGPDVHLRELVEYIQMDLGYTLKADEVRNVIRAYHAAVTEYLDYGRQVSLRGWGKYATRRQKAKTKVAFGKEVSVPEKDVPYFHFSDHLKDLIARPGPEQSDDD